VPPDSPAPVTLARVLRPWGRRGEVAAEILTDFPERLAALGGVWLADGRGGIRPVSIASCRLHLGQAIIHFEGVSSIDDAEKLRGLEVQVPLSERVVLPEGRYYLTDLAGCAVWEQGGAVQLGVVREVQPLRAAGEKPEAWLLAVETVAGELLIPLASEICTHIDIVGRRIDVRLPDGLRHLNR
jgi:16S rRNA processing protein RimM